MENQILSPMVSDLGKHDPFDQVMPGMDVYDQFGRRVGKVDGLHGGSEKVQPAAGTVVPVAVSATSQQPVPVVAAVPQPSSTVPVFDDVMEHEDDVPQELRERLEHDGFIRIDAGFLKHHRYALRGQVENVAGERVTLNVGAGELFKH